LDAISIDSSLIKPDEGPPIYIPRGGVTARPFQVLDWTGDHKHKRLYSRMMGKEEGKVTAKDEMDGAEADQVVAVFNDIGAPVDVDTVKQAALDMSQGHNQRVTFSCFKRLLANMPTIIGFGGDGRENEKKGIVENHGAEYRVTDWKAERSVHARYYFDQAVQEEGLAEPAHDPQVPCCPVSDLSDIFECAFWIDEG
jgi:hypothetical protein